MKRALHVLLSARDASIYWRKKGGTDAAQEDRVGGPGREVLVGRAYGYPAWDADRFGRASAEGRPEKISSLKKRRKNTREKGA